MGDVAVRCAAGRGVVSGNRATNRSSAARRAVPDRSNGALGDALPATWSYRAARTWARNVFALAFSSFAMPSTGRRRHLSWAPSGCPRQAGSGVLRHSRSYSCSTKFNV